MSDVKPCPICDASMIKHCPNEKAALKYCGKSMMGELSRLRAELAAEKERCAKIAEGWSPFTPNSSTATNIAAAIRASNAAPLESLPGELARHWLSEGGTPAPAAAPPHVEPSAAESEMSPLMRAAALHEACRPRPSATEARMLELARKTQRDHGDAAPTALAALVIETFGGKK